AATQAPTGGLTGLVYRSVRGVTRVVGGGLDAALAVLAPLLDRIDTTSDEREAVLAALNGVLGDHLAASGNALAVAMELRRDGLTLPLAAAEIERRLPRPGGKLVFLLHGLCMNDRQWRHHGHDHGEGLAAAGWTPLYLRYNSGRHISENGRDCAALLENVLAVWPVPVTEIVLLGHSMGGLVARSACHYGAQAGHAWLGRVRKMIFLGSPHHGSYLEKGGNWIDLLLGASPYTAAFARLGKVRSAGITDLRQACLRDEDWRGGDRFAPAQPAVLPLPAGVRCYAAAATLAKAAGAPGAGLVGDGLVSLDSALGRHGDAARDLGIPAARQWVGYGMNHLDLLSSTELYARIERWIAAPD
ncbi:MAG: alpha/beta hydrolase, partial [Rhodocyclales bacterium]|nr:alpha/beta hydrolase [Rhodocyclales bacterium]